MMLASIVHRRPRWAIPRVTSSTPCSAPRSIVSASNGIRLSEPSSEKLFRAEVFTLDELLQNYRVGEERQNASLFRDGNLETILGPLHPLLEPVLRLDVVDVHELDADRAAVGVPQALEDFSEREGLGSVDRAARKAPIHVVVRQVVIFRIEFGDRWHGHPERVDLRAHVTADAVRANELVHAILPDRDVERLVRRRGAE